MNTVNSGEFCKAGRTTEKYGLNDSLRALGDEWSEPNGEGVRKLAKRFNEAVVEEALRDAGMEPLEGESEMMHQLLTREDIEPRERQSAYTRLEEHGIDPEELTGDFVSYKTINRHFKNCTNRRRETPEQTHTAEDALESIQRLKRRLEQITEDSIARLAEDSTDGKSEAEVIVNINIVDSSGEQHSVRQLLGDSTGPVTRIVSRNAQPESTGGS